MSLNLFEIFFRISIIYVLIATGSFLRHLSSDPDNSILIKYLTKIILTIFFPFLVISSILNVSIDSFSIVIISILFSLVVMGVGLFSVFTYSRFKSIPDQTLGSMFLAVSFPNSVFLPFPLILMLVGPQGLISATLFAVTVIIVQNSLGSYLAIKFGHHLDPSASLHFKDIFKKVVYFPPTLSMIAGFIIKIFFQPSSFASFFSFLPFSSGQINFSINGISWISLVLALILVGLTFNLSFTSLHNRFLTPTAIFRLISAPIVAIVFLFFTYEIFFPAQSLKSDFAIPLVIQAFSGPAIINIAFSKQFGLDVESESMYITVITLLSLLIIPLIVVLFYSFF